MRDLHISEGGRLAARTLAESLRRKGIRDERVLEAIASIPREVFVPPEERALAYEDMALPLKCGQTVSQPYIVALMTEALETRPTDTILEIGGGSGYQASVLSQLVDGIIVTAAAPRVPQPLLDQLKPGRSLVIPVGDEWLQRLIRVRRDGDRLQEDFLCDCRFVKLIGRYGWPET